MSLKREFIKILRRGLDEDDHDDDHSDHDDHGGHDDHDDHSVDPDVFKVIMIAKIGTLILKRP